MNESLRFEVNPWSDGGHLSEVYENLFRFKSHADDIESHQAVIHSLSWARDQLIVWTSRSGDSKYVLEFEATCSLVSAIIEDEKNTYLKSSLVEPVDLHSLFCFALVRFYNLLCYYEVSESGTIQRICTKSNVSIKPLAEKLGLPPWLLECRHEICHAALPQMVLLRQAVFICLRWLDHNFWRKLLKYAASAPNISDHREMVEYCCQRCLTGTGEDVAAARKWLAKSFQSNSLLTCSALGDFLLKEADLAADSLGGDANFEAIPQNAERYTPLLQLVINKDLVSMLLYVLSEHFTSEENRAPATAWCSFLLQSMLSTNKDSSLARCFMQTKNCHPSGTSKIMWLRLMYNMVKSPNELTLSMLENAEKVLKNVVPINKLHALTELVKIYLGIIGQDGASIDVQGTLKTVDMLRTACGTSVKSLDERSAEDWLLLNLGSDPFVSDDGEQVVEENGAFSTISLAADVGDT